MHASLCAVKYFYQYLKELQFYKSFNTVACITWEISKRVKVEFVFNLNCLDLWNTFSTIPFAMLKNGWRVHKCIPRAYASKCVISKCAEMWYRATFTGIIWLFQAKAMCDGPQMIPADLGLIHTCNHCSKLRSDLICWNGINYFIVLHIWFNILLYDVLKSLHV